MPDFPAPFNSLGSEVASIADLRCLVACADAGTLPRAAKLLNVEISTVYRRISNLEDEFGLSLFERHRSGIRTTRAGRAVVERARRVLAEMESFLQMGCQHASGAIGEIHLGVRVPPIGGAAFALLESWHSSFPDVVLKVVEGMARRTDPARVLRDPSQALAHSSFDSVGDA